MLLRIPKTSLECGMKRSSCCKLQWIMVKIAFWFSADFLSIYNSEMSLRAREEKCDMRPDRSNEIIHKIAVNLEKRLYKSAVSFESYCDMRTLESRLKVVLYEWTSQRRDKKRRRSSLTKRRRSQFLKEKLGRAGYALAEWLVVEIKQKRTSLASESCAQCQIRNPDISITSSFGEQLPLPVRNLFFNTPLVDVFETYSLQRLQYYGHHYLEELIVQAEKTMREYDDWKLTNSICPL
jgi:hypothetical protein